MLAIPWQRTQNVPEEGHSHRASERGEVLLGLNLSGTKPSYASAAGHHGTTSATMERAYVWSDPQADNHALRTPFGGFIVRSILASFLSLPWPVLLYLRRHILSMYAANGLSQFCTGQLCPVSP